MNSTKQVEIVIPVHNRRDITVQCLKSLSRINRDGLFVHIIVVDDGSTDGTADAIRGSFPDVELVFGNGDLWFTGATNKGIEAALRHDPDYVLTINDDSVFDAEFLTRLVETAESNSNAVVGPLLLLWDTPHRLFQVAPKWDVWSGGYRHWHRQTVWTVPDNAWEVDLIVGNCVLFPVESIKRFGLMNEKKFPHYGDAEYTPRMKKAGWKLLIDPRSRVFCQPNTPPPKVRKMGAGKLIKTLFLDLGNAHSLRRRFYSVWYGAPNRLEGLAAFPIFFIRYLIGKNLEGKYAERVPEAPLANTYAKSVVKR